MMSCWVRRCASPVSIKEGFAAGDGDVARQHLEGGGFSGPVDPQQPETLADTTGGVYRLFEHGYALYRGCFGV